MSSRKPPFQYVDIHGRPLGGAKELGLTVKQVAEAKARALIRAAELVEEGF